jgi:hypothetical protein
MKFALVLVLIGICWPQEIVPFTAKSEIIFAEILLTLALVKICLCAYQKYSTSTCPAEPVHYREVFVCKLNLDGNASLSSESESDIGTDNAQHSIHTATVSSTCSEDEDSGSKDKKDHGKSDLWRIIF